MDLYRSLRVPSLLHTWRIVTYSLCIVTYCDVYSLNSDVLWRILPKQWRIVTYTHGDPGVFQYVHRRQSIRGIHH